MAGSCYGDGLTVDGLGRIALDGPRSASWPGGSACTLEAHNGIKVDPDTHKLWVAPAAAIQNRADNEANRTLVPNATGVVALSSLSLTMPTLSCNKEYVQFFVAGGHVGMRQGTGNFWIVERTFTIYIDGTPVGFTGVEDIGGAENNSGGAISQSGPVESTMYQVQADPGQVVRLAATYRLNVLTYNASGVNSVAWRPPKIEGVLFGHPQ